MSPSNDDIVDGEQAAELHDIIAAVGNALRCLNEKTAVLVSRPLAIAEQSNVGAWQAVQVGKSYWRASFCPVPNEQPPAIRTDASVDGGTKAFRVVADTYEESTELEADLKRHGAEARPKILFSAREILSNLEATPWKSIARGVFPCDDHSAYAVCLFENGIWFLCQRGLGDATSHVREPNVDMWYCTHDKKFVRFGKAENISKCVGLPVPIRIVDTNPAAIDYFDDGARQTMLPAFSDGSDTDHETANALRELVSVLTKLATYANLVSVDPVMMGNVRHRYWLRGFFPICTREFEFSSDNSGTYLSYRFPPPRSGLRTAIGEAPPHIQQFGAIAKELDSVLANGCFGRYFGIDFEQVQKSQIFFSSGHVYWRIDWRLLSLKNRELYCTLFEPGKVNQLIGPGARFFKRYY